MLIRKPNALDGSNIPSSEITPREKWLSRRGFLSGAASLGAAALGAGALSEFVSPSLTERAASKLTTVPSPISTHGEELTSLQDITHYNNFYEFSTDKYGVAPRAKHFITRPWTVEVGGLAHKPRTFDLDDLARLAPPEERVYRHRCVEGWSMVIPWIGFPLSRLLDQVQPMGSARFVAFETLADPKQMPNIDTRILDWPYVEGLRLDEAMHPLSILALGLYGETLLPQNGAPLRLVVPWKYGFKGIKSIIRIRLLEAMPPTSWNLASPNEYGFYSNVNPHVDHPRWSQATEQRIGVPGRRETLMFNGYADQVAGLYSGLDLKVNF